MNIQGIQSQINKIGDVFVSELEKLAQELDALENQSTDSANRQNNE